MVAISWIFNLLVRAFYVGLLGGLLDAPHGSMDGQLSGKTMGKAMGFNPRKPMGKSPENFDKHTHYGSWLDVGWTLLLVFRMKLFSFSRDVCL
jgi:hypothetical protein